MVAKSERDGSGSGKGPPLSNGRFAPKPIAPAGYAALMGLILAVVAVAFVAYGRPLAAPGGLEVFGSATGRDGSRALFDAYTLLHVVFGMVLRGVLWATSCHWPRGWLYVVVLASAAVWEAIENAPPVVERYTLNPTSRDYAGDSLLNAAGDMAAVVSGYAAARLLPLPLTAGVAVAVEAGVTAAGLDGILAAGWKLVVPPES